MSSSLCQTNRCVNDESALIVLMDIDNTMIETSVFPSQEAADEYVAKLPTFKRMFGKEPCEERVLFYQHTTTNGSIMHFNFRPGLLTFLRALSKTCELHIYTAGNQVYAEYVAHLLGFHYFSKDRIWSKCGGWISTCDGGWHWKEISKLPLGRNGDLSRVVLIDDNLQTLLANPANVYPVSKFCNDPSDVELCSALEYFNSKLIDCEDVRQVLLETNKGTVARLMEFHSRDTFMLQEPFTMWKDFASEQTRLDQGSARTDSINTAMISNRKRGREAMTPSTTATVTSTIARALSCFKNHPRKNYPVSNGFVV